MPIKETRASIVNYIYASSKQNYNEKLYFTPNIITTLKMQQSPSRSLDWHENTEFNCKMSLPHFNNLHEMVLGWDENTDKRERARIMEPLAVSFN